MKLFVPIVFMLFILSCVENKDSGLKQEMNTDSENTTGKNKTSEMVIKKEFLSGTDTSEIINTLVENCYPEYDYENLDRLDMVSQTFVLIINMDGQVQNGGIVQFIDNSTGKYFHETEEALERIKSDRIIEILNKAASQFPNGKIPADSDLRRQLLEKIGEKYITTGVDNDIVDEDWEQFWEDLDSFYYDHYKQMYQNLIVYLTNNAKLID